MGCALSIPNQIAWSVFIPITQKPVTNVYDKFRTTGVMSQLSKLVIRVALNRTKNKIFSEISKEQYRF